MDLKHATAIFLPAIEDELKRQIARLDEARTRPFYEMLTYHMGWSGQGAGPEAQGKRIRPLLVLLTTASCSAPWQPALPAAAAVELVHNFSLVHDDIQDNSDLRRGRPTIWKQWGVPQAINVGDALFVLANLAILDLSPAFLPETILQAGQMLQSACLDLTRGQFLDIAYENRSDLHLEDYWVMVSGKTAALLSTCCALGALLGGADEEHQLAYRDFGHYLGLAFQAQDDLLGIWGDSALTGKSAKSDLVAGKKSLPILYGLQKGGEFARRWAQGPIQAGEVPTLAETLTREGARLYTQQVVDQMTDLALQSLRLAEPHEDVAEALFELVDFLLNRQA
ncbi:MAG: polyprenyl synthetase family protein [Anaerolineales bacterium]|nr:polyprenyl synthetase family protein [Anaerolineales bacterium]